MMSLRQLAQEISDADIPHDMIVFAAARRMKIRWAR
jgi:hypothetical protein